MHTIREIQAKLIDLGRLAATAPDGTSNIDGKFGELTLDAYNHYRASLGERPVVQADPLQVEADLWPDVFPLPETPTPSIFDQIGTLFSIYNILKGKTVTADQITGIVRLVLGIAAGYFVSKGLVSQAVFDWISAGVLTAIPAVWSWLNNRPKTIVPIAAK